MTKKQGKDIHMIDKAARDMILTELDKTMLVEAGAGSGKTTNLINRMVALIGEGKASIEKISAVTFTRKAAAELRERFQIELEDRFQDSTGKKKERYGTALSNLEQGFAGTIHSFCARLLRERPVEAGIDLAFVELDEIDDRLHQNDIWDEYMIHLLYEDGVAFETLDALDVNSKELREIYHTLVLYPEVAVFTREIPAPDIREARRQLESFLSSVRENLPESMPADGWDDLMSAILNTQRMMYVLDLDERKDFFRILNMFEKNLKVVQKRWPNTSIGKDMQNQLGAFQDNVVTPALTQWRKYRHSHLMKIVQPAADFCRKDREEKSTLNFQDLLMKASQMLRDNPEVRSYFRKRFTHILIDEFQDTDPIQAEVMLYLTGTNVKEGDWRKVIPEHGSLFIVGDPKQSIYRFRRADIDTYSSVKQVIQKTGGMIVELKSNFRSLPAIADWLNPIFKERFPKDGSAYQAPYGELSTVRENEAKTVYGIRKITISKKNRNKQAEIVADDAQRIAIWIRHALNGNIKLARTDSEKKMGFSEKPVPSDFLILLRNKKMIPDYAKKLEEYGIPFEVAGGNAFKTAYGLREIIKILKAIAEPDSAVDLVSVLRGLFFGMSDDMLYRFKKGGGRFSFNSIVPDTDKIEDGVKSVFQNAFDRVKQYRDWTKTLPPSVAIEKIIEDVGLIPYLLSDEMGGSQTGNILKVQEFLQHLDMQGTADFLSVVENLDTLLEEGEMDEIDIAHGSLKAVRIMNLHKAKGLEAPVVFLANPSGRSEHLTKANIERKGNEAIGYFAITNRGDKGNEYLIAIPPGWEENESEEKRYSDAEEDRLLYVASTRAKNLLVISTYPEKKEINHWSMFDEYLETIQELEQPPISPSSPKDKVVVKKKDFDKVQERIISNIENIKQQTYAVENVTSLTKTEADFPIWKNTGRGLKWGNVIHRVLEAVARGIKDSDLDLLISNVLAEQGRASEEKTVVISLIEEMRNSDFWKEIESAKEKFVEVPFSLRLKPTDLALPTSSGEWVILSGTIDLVYKSDGGWTIVDYKTDDVGERLVDFINYYSPQVKVYSRFWEEMSGEKVIKAGLYFIHTKQFIPVVI